MISVLSRSFQYRHFSLAVLVALIALVGCGGDGDDNGGGGDDSPDLTAQQERAQALAGTWASNQVLESPGDAEDAALQELGSLEITFGVNQTTLAPTSFDASNAPTYFNAGSGATWAWADNSTTADINLSAVAPVSAFSITALNGNDLTISFDFQGPSTSRIEGIGTYRVQLTKQ